MIQVVYKEEGDRGEIIYRGERLVDPETGVLETLVTVSDHHGIRALDLRLDLRNHSPTGFEWGYAGSGPAQLALAILADLMDDDEAAHSCHQRFKFQVVAGFPKQSWEITSEAIRAFLAMYPPPSIDL